MKPYSESYWLIEFFCDNQKGWWDGGGTGTATMDRQQAIRFSRAQDATCCLQISCKGYGHIVEVPPSDWKQDAT